MRVTVTVHTATCSHHHLFTRHALPAAPQLRLMTYMFRKKLGLLFKKSCVKIDHDDQTPPGYMSLKKCGGAVA